MIFLMLFVIRGSRDTVHGTEVKGTDKLLLRGWSLNTT